MPSTRPVPHVLDFRNEGKPDTLGLIPHVRDDSFGFSKELRNVYDIYPLMPRKWHILFSAARKVCKRAAAAPDAAKGSEKAWSIVTASAKAEEKGERRCYAEARGYEWFNFNSLD